MVEVTERPAAGSEEVSETIEVVTQLPAGLVPQTTEAAVGDAVTEFEEDQITTDSPHSVTSVAESGPIETLEKAVKPENLPAAAENPVETGNTFTTVANPTGETESATEAVVNILQDVSGVKIVDDDDDDDAVSTETTMDTTISSENIAVEGGEKSDVIQGGSGGESKLVDLVTGSNLGQVSTTLTPPQEQPVTFFPSEEEGDITDQINNVIIDSDTSNSELVFASNEIPDAAAPKVDESDASE